MPELTIIYREVDGAWPGFIRDYPDYWTQGEDLEDLTEHLRDLYRDLTQGCSAKASTAP